MARYSATRDAKALESMDNLQFADYLYNLLNAWKRHGYHLYGPSGVDKAAKDLSRAKAGDEDVRLFAGVFAARRNAAKAIRTDLQIAIQESHRRYGKEVSTVEAAQVEDALRISKKGYEDWVAALPSNSKASVGQRAAARLQGRAEKEAEILARLDGRPKAQAPARPKDGVVPNAPPGRGAPPIPQAPAVEPQARSETFAEAYARKKKEGTVPADPPPADWAAKAPVEGVGDHGG